MYVINEKNESINILKQYFQNFDINELLYYLDIKPNQTIPTFFNDNVYESDEIELKTLLEEHLDIVIKKIFQTKNILNKLKKSFGLSFITRSIYWLEIFSIDNTLFITYPYLIEIFDRLESKIILNSYQFYIKDNKKYDIELLKKLTETIYCILQYQNQNKWFDVITTKYKCKYVDKIKIKFDENYKILREPNTNFIGNKIPIYWFKDNIFICVINLISSTISFSPYYEFKLILLLYNNGEYFQTNCNNQLENQIENIYCNYESNPFLFRAKEITNILIHN